MIDFERINSAAQSQLESLLPELLPGGKFVGPEYRAGSLNGGPGDSLGVNLRTCKWKDFADTVKGGDHISLAAAVRGCSQLEAAKWLGERLGVECDQWQRHAPIQKQQSCECPQEGEKTSWPWKQAKRDDGSVKKYLSSRAINLDEIPKALKWGQYTDKQTGQEVVQIVAAASKPSDEKVYAVQRLIIDPATRKKTGAKMLGQVSGRGVWFDRKGDHATVAVGEGVETCLSFLQATNGIFSTVAAMSAGNMPALELHEETQCLYILTDSDLAAKGMAGQKAAYTTAKQFEASRPDRKAWIVTPDDTCFTDDPAKLDFNDLLQEDPTGDSIGFRLEKAIPFEKLQWLPMANDQNSGLPEGGNATKIDPKQALERFLVKREYTEKLGKEEFLIDNLLISQHILVVVAMSGGGKTAFFYRFVGVRWYCLPMPTSTGPPRGT